MKNSTSFKNDYNESQITNYAIDLHHGKDYPNPE